MFLPPAIPAFISNMVIHKEFVTAGRTAGLQVWRVEKLELVPVPQSLHGSFYSGDAYVILNTIRQRESFFYHLHYWLGKSTTVEGPSAAAR